MDEKTMRKIEDRVVEIKSKSFTTPTNEAVVKAWEAFDKRVVDVYDPDTYVWIEGEESRQVLGIGGDGDIIRGIELRKENPTPAEELDAWMLVSDFMGDVFPRFVNPTEDRVRFIVDEWNDLMDAIAHDDEEASPDVRQAAEDQKIVALGLQNDSLNGVNGSLKGMEVYDDTVGMDEILSLRKYDATATILNSCTTPDGVHEVTYVGWDCDDEIIYAERNLNGTFVRIIYAGGYVNGAFVRPDEVDRAGLFDKLSEDVKAELEPLAGTTCSWNCKILEIQDNVDSKDAELLDALWIRAILYRGEVTVYGVDAGVTKMNEDDFEILGLHRIYLDSAPLG